MDGINTEGTHIHNYDSISYADTDGMYLADQTPIKDATNLENMGLAVFKDDKLVGELNGLETICHSMVTNILKRCTISMTSPFNDDDIVSLTFIRDKNTKNTVSLVNGSPYINVEIYLNANIISANPDVDFSKTENLELVSDAANTYIENQVTNFLYKTSKEYKSDICGFGKYLISDYTTTEEWLKSDWKNNYQNAFFNVSVNTSISSGNLFVKH